MLEMITYEEFEKELSKFERFSIEHVNAKIHVFFNYGEGESNSIREPLFTISKERTNEIVSPVGFRLTNYKSMAGYNEVAALTIRLTRTPIKFRT